MYDNAGLMLSKTAVSLFHFVSYKLQPAYQVSISMKHGKYGKWFEPRSQQSPALYKITVESR